MVRMRDGIRLATDIYRPAVDGRPLDEPASGHPGADALRQKRTVALGDRARHDPADDAGEVAAHFVRAGYVVIYQDCRGRYDSEGEFTKYLSEGPDGYDTCAWIVEQPWCDGQIGTMGLSYAAHTQAALACLNPPGLACMVLDSGGFSSAYRTGIRQGGAFELKQLTWAYNNAKESPRRRTIRSISQRARGRGHQGLVQRDALVGRTLAGALGAGIRGLCARAMAARRRSAISGRRPASTPRALTTVSRRCRSR